MNNEHKLLSKSEIALSGIIVLLRAMKENPSTYINLSWSQTGHGQYAMDVLKELQEYNKK